MLSGGEQQRVSLARALMVSPGILLCDEPFSALDPLIRAELQSLLIATAKNTTLVFVTHDVREALVLANRLGLMEKGRIVFLDTPERFLKSENSLARSYVGSLELNQQHGGQR